LPNDDSTTTSALMISTFTRRLGTRKPARSPDAP
jgi:hypothetical protein